MQNNLTVNGIDHGIFDEKWAKRGGVISQISADNGVVSLLQKVGIRYVLLAGVGFAGFKITPNYGYVNYTPEIDTLRMATPDECQAAGVDYIEKPALLKCDGNHALSRACTDKQCWHIDKSDHWLPIESAPKDGSDVVLLRTHYGEMRARWDVVEEKWRQKGSDRYFDHDDFTNWQQPQQPKDLKNA